jgi:hypothetical protein
MIWEVRNNGGVTLASDSSQRRAHKCVDPFLYSRPIPSRLHGFRGYDFTSGRSGTLTEWVLKFKSSGFLHQAEWQISTDASMNRGVSHFWAKQYKKNELLTIKIGKKRFFEMWR